jgi:hypothetical protein
MPGMGDGFKMSWGADDRQYVVLNDGTGWSDAAPETFFKRSLWRMSGGPTSATVSPIANYPNVDASMEPDDVPDYHGHGLLAVNGKVYQFLGALDRAQERPRHWNTAKLIYSDDGGNNWRNQGGSYPVRGENWDQQSRDSLIFFNEPDGCFSLLSFLQMGQDYRANRDGFVYVYSPNGNSDGLMNELVMFRVPASKVLDRAAYEYFAGRTARGFPIWNKNIAARRPVHVFPRGWVNSTSLFPGDIVVETWLPSVVYNEPLGLYMMVSAGTGCASDGTEFARPSYLGFWVSHTPWGPWRQIHEETGWTPGGDMASRPYSPQIAPKWVAPDGKSLWLVWTDLKGIRSLSDPGTPSTAGPPAGPPEDLGRKQGALAEAEMMRRAMPLYSLNAQRLDLDLG